MRALASKNFNPRAFVALVASVTGLGLPITGLGNHILQFDPMTRARHAWMAAHNGLGVLFVTSAVWHVWLNRRAFLGHWRGTTENWRRISREALWATALIASILFVAVGHAFHAP